MDDNINGASVAAEDAIAPDAVEETAKVSDDRTDGEDGEPKSRSSWITPRLSKSVSHLPSS